MYTKALSSSDSQSSRIGSAGQEGLVVMDLLHAVSTPLRAAQRPGVFSGHLRRLVEMTLVHHLQRGLLLDVFLPSYFPLPLQIDHRDGSLGEASPIATLLCHAYDCCLAGLEDSTIRVVDRNVGGFLSLLPPPLSPILCRATARPQSSMQAQAFMRDARRRIK